MTTPCLPTCEVSSYHSRLYAVNLPDYNYNVYWGYYIFGTSHRDKNEACFYGTEYGWSEQAEAGVMNVAINTLGWTVWSDWTFFYNCLNPAWFGNHRYETNGYVTWVFVP